MLLFPFELFLIVSVFCLNQRLVDLLNPLMNIVCTFLQKPVFLQL